MAFSRSLLIKGLAGGLGACTACAGGVGIYKSVSSSEENIENLTDKQLIDRAGLNCELGDSDSLQESETKNCTVKAGGKINVKNKTSNEDDVAFQNPDSGGAKLKVSRSTEGGYSKNLKFVVDSGDITLNKENATPASITKLGQYETYEIVKEGSKYYLSLKDSVEEGKIRELGLPVGESYCKLLETGSSSCKLSTEDIKKVKFNGAESTGVTVTGGSEVKLTITKTEDTSSFTDGYRFTFTFPGEVTISAGNSVKANTPTDFKIKKAASGNGLTLEKAWSDDNEFIKKVGLDCNNKESCVISTTGTPSTLSVKVGEKTKEGITSLGDGGKIKLEKEQEGYNEGLKFTITTGDITLNNGGQGDISKLEEFETYEITEAGGKYFLTKKTGKEGVIKTALGLPCDLPAQGSIDCVVPANKAKGVKFDGQGNQKPSEQITLRIEKTDDTSAYPHGYKFTLESDKDIALSDTSTIKKNTNTVFKIKKNGDALSLEKAWEINKILEKVGLSGCTDGADCAIKNSNGPLNIKRDDKTLTATAFSGGKIKFSKDQEGYNQGFKFTISDNDVTLTGVNSPDNKLEELETYEITEDGSNYYLTRKTTKEEAIKKSLSIPDACFAPVQGSEACSPLKTSELSAINFDGKTEGTNRFGSNANGKAYLTISKATNTSDFPLGYRFTFLTTGEMSITNDNKVKANIPTEFKIKKADSGNGLTLVKAWNSNGDNLIAKVGLENCSDDSSECNIKSSGGLNVKQGEATYDNKTKSSAQSNQGKIKLYKEQEGYVEGLKFVIEDNDITLSNTGGSSTIKLTQFETYGIEENGGKYYLSRKTDGKDEKIKKLGLPDHCKWEESSSKICLISQEQLKSVKFKNKKNSDSQVSAGSGDIKVIFAEAKANETTTHPEGLKVSFMSLSNTDINIPLDGTDGGAIVLRKEKSKEFKITKEGDGTLSLEKAFDINKFVKEAGLENCYDDLGCSLKDNLNVWLESDKYSFKAKVDNGSKVHKVSYEEVNSGGYNKGIKFTLQNPITIQKGDSAEAVHKGDVTSLNKGDEFHVMQHEINETNYWFLSKVKKK